MGVIAKLLVAWFNLIGTYHGMMLMVRFSVENLTML